MVVAYVRAARASSTQLDAQRQWIEDAVGPIDRTYRDVGSGMEIHQGLEDAIASLNAGDVLAVYQLDRLSRSPSLTVELLRRVKLRGASVEAASTKED